MNGMDSNQFLTKKEAAEYMRVSERTIDNWRRQGLPAMKRGNWLRIDLPDLLRFAQASKETSHDGEHQQ